MPPNRKLFVNLPVEDLDRSIAFFSELGFGFEDGFTDETAGCMRIGATSVGETQDHGFMYSRSFQDPDGHHWEVVRMDQAAVAQALEDSTPTG